MVATKIVNPSSNTADAEPSSVHLLPPPFNYSSPAPTLVTQGAESLLYKTHFLDTATPAALKVRPPKPYRHVMLDRRLSKQRVLAEARVMVKLASLASPDVRVPGVYGVEWEAGRRVKGLDSSQRGVNGEKPSGGSDGSWILMEWIHGLSVKDSLRQCEALWKSESLSPGAEEQLERDGRALLRRVGRAVGTMHSQGGVVHGDLTTSNILVSPRDPQPHLNGTGHHDDHHTTTDAQLPELSGSIVLIDFGLASQTVQDEDRAVDLYVLERAFGSTHPRAEAWFDAEVLQSEEGYLGSFRGAGVVLKRLEEVRLRGRKRSMLG